MKKILATAMLAFALLAVPACSMRAGVNRHRTRLHRHTPANHVQDHDHGYQRRDRHHDRGHGHQKHRQQHSGQQH